MEFTRRETLAIGAGAAALAVLPIRGMASVDEEIADFTGGAEVVEGGVTLTAPRSPRTATRCRSALTRRARSRFGSSPRTTPAPRWRP